MKTEEKKEKQWEERARTSRSGGQSFDKEEVLLKAGPGELPGEVVKSLSLQAFKTRVDTALKDMVSEHGGDGLTVGLMILVVSSNLSDYVIL